MKTEWSHRKLVPVLTAWIDKGPFIFYEVGGLVEFFEPPLRISMAPSVLIFSHGPPQRRLFFWVTPPFKRDIIVIKPDMHIFCSVQYDLYFPFNVKLLTTHSTDVAATSVNSKNKSCPLAKALLHYFSKSKSQFPIFRLWIFLVIDKGKDDIFTPSWWN